LPLRFLSTDRRAQLALVLLFIVSLPAITRRIYAGDEAQYFSYLRSVYFDHDVSFQNEYEYFADRGLSGGRIFRETFLESTTPTGLRENWGTIGSAILWAPFYGVGDLYARSLRAAGRPIDVDGFSGPYISAACYASAFYGLMALLLSLAATGRLASLLDATVGDRAVAVVSVWLGTPLLFYMYIAPPFAHACSAFAVALFVWIWLRVRDDWSPAGLAALGASVALMTMVREQDAFYAVAPAIDFAWSAVAPAERLSAKALRRRLVGVVAAAIACAVTFLPQAVSYLAINGRIGPSHLVSRKMTWWSPHALQVILSPEHGFLFWTPLAVLSLVGLGVLLRVSSGSNRRLAVGLAAMFVCQVYVNGSVESWSVGGAFGQRRFVGLAVVLVIGLAALLARVRGTKARWAMGVALAACLWWNLAMMVQFGTGLMDRQRLDLPRNAYQTFVGVPTRLPQLAWRYLFDRASFYQSHQGPAR
jgi:hypothetical protein